MQERGGGERRRRRRIRGGGGERHLVNSTNKMLRAPLHKTIPHILCTHSHTHYTHTLGRLRHEEVCRDSTRADSKHSTA